MPYAARGEAMAMFIPSLDAKTEGRPVSRAEDHQLLAERPNRARVIRGRASR